MELALFDKIGQSISGNDRSSMFGVIAFKIGRKPFIMFYDNQMVCKLFGEFREEALQLEGTSIFNPKKNKQPMNNWIQIPFEHADRWEYFANLAYQFVNT